MLSYKNYKPTVSRSLFKRILWSHQNKNKIKGNSLQRFYSAQKDVWGKLGKVDNSSNVQNKWATQKTCTGIFHKPIKVKGGTVEGVHGNLEGLISAVVNALKSKVLQFKA